MHIGRMLRIVEEHQLAGCEVDLAMRRNAVERHPAFGTELFEREREASDFANDLSIRMIADEEG